MSGIGRNDPCPCGSGKKYKKCCLLAAGAPSAAWTQAERQNVLIALGRFGWRHEFDGDRAGAEARFWPDALDRLPEAERVESMSARERLAGRPAYDFGWMWAELGLTRPG
jgi:hypothetical protein